jgi:hypothetical protein
MSIPTYQVIIWSACAGAIIEIFVDAWLQKPIKRKLRAEIKRNQKAWFHNGWRKAEKLQYSKFKASDEFIDGNFDYMEKDLKNKI